MHILKSGIFAAKVLRKAEAADGLMDEKWITFRVDTERGMMYDDAVVDTEPYDEYSITLIDRGDDECFKRGGTAAKRQSGRSLAPRAPAATGRRTQNNRTNKTTKKIARTSTRGRSTY